jgi:hypothetical protein
VKKIAITKGMTITVDDADYPAVSQFCWHASQSGPDRFYVRAFIDGKRTYLHRFLLKPQGKMTVDHIDGNRLNNCRSNLRLATRTENNRNRPPSKNKKFKGVFAQRNGYGFMARIVVNKRPVYLGNFKMPEDAALAYDIAASREFGEFANLNFPT